MPRPPPETSCEPLDVISMSRGAWARREGGSIAFVTSAVRRARGESRAARNSRNGVTFDRLTSPIRTPSVLLLHCMTASRPGWGAIGLSSLRGWASFVHSNPYCVDGLRTQSSSSQQIRRRSRQHAGGSFTHVHQCPLEVGIIHHNSSDEDLGRRTDMVATVTATSVI